MLDSYPMGFENVSTVLKKREIQHDRGTGSVLPFKELESKGLDSKELNERPFTE